MTKNGTIDKAALTKLPKTSGTVKASPDRRSGQRRRDGSGQQVGQRRPLR